MPEDTTPPVISLIGGITIPIPCESQFQDPGFIAVDLVDGNINENVVISGDTVNTSGPGTFVIRYDVTDAAGNPAPQATRTVSVTCIDDDVTPPMISLVGEVTINVPCEQPFQDPGVVATDDVDGDITEDVLISGDPVDTAGPGTFVIRYDVTDAAGNPAQQVTRTVIVTCPLVSDGEVYVATPVDGGRDDSGIGSAEMPWASIAFAMAQAGAVATEQDPVTIFLQPGTYPENIVFLPYVSIEGIERRRPAAVSIEPTRVQLSESNGVAVNMAEGSALRYVRVLPNLTASEEITLVQIAQVNARVENAVIDGRGFSGSIGIRILGVESFDSVIQRILLRSLSNGIRSLESNANVSRNRFERIREDAIFINEPVAKGLAGPTTLNLGDDAFENSGFNQMIEVDGFFVNNDDPRTSPRNFALVDLILGGQVRGRAAWVRPC